MNPTVKTALVILGVIAADKMLGLSAKVIAVVTGKPA